MTQQRPNIIFITTDQHRYDSVGFNHNSHVRTAALDALAADGLVLDNCFVPTAVCAPTRASLMTGRYPCLHGQLSNGFTIRDGERLWWHDLAEAGYRTAGIGKMHVEPWDDPLGWEDNIRVEGKDWLTGTDEYVKFLRKHGYEFNRPRQAPEFASSHWSRGWLSPVPTEHYIDTYIGNRAVEYIEHVAQDERPLAAWISFCGPHHPVDPPAEYADRYADTPVPPHVFDPQELATKPPEQEQMFRWKGMTEEDRVRCWRYYWAMVELIDDQIGRIVSALQKTGRWNDTFIVFTADHGEMLWQHGMFDKAFAFYDDIYRVPALVRWPGHIEPGRYDGLVESIDLIPPLLEAGGRDVPLSLCGRNVLAMADGRETPRDTVLGQHFHMRMVRTKEAKLVAYAHRDYGELYDLRADPNEMTNLWDDPGSRELRAALYQSLVNRLIDATDPAFRQLPEPTNKGAYDGYLRQHTDLAARYLLP